MQSNVLSMHGTLSALPGPLQYPSGELIPAQAERCLEEGLARLQAGEAAEAVTALSETVECAPDFAPGHVFLGIAQALTSDIYPALDHLEAATKLDPDSFAAHYTLAQLNFKLRIPQAGYESAQNALRCARTIEQRKMLTQLLREERAKERNGIARPLFNKPFSVPALFLLGSGLAALVLVVVLHLR
jgi:tetratricopeptide (TPR) repeat protein